MLNKKISENKDFISKQLYYIIVFLWFSLDYLYSLDISNFSWGTYSVYLRLLSPLKYLIILYILLFREYSIKGWLIISGISLILFISARRSGLYDIFYAFLFIIASKKDYMKKSIKMAVILLISYIVISIICAVSGIINNTLYYRGNGMVRYSLGFPHPNQFGFRVFILITGLIWLREGKLRYYHFIIILFSVIFTWFVVNSRTACFCIILITIASLFTQKFKELKCSHKEEFLILIAVMVLAITLILLFMTIFYTGDGIPAQINKLLSQRLEFGHNAYNEFGTSLLGQKIFVTASERKIAGLGEEIIIDSAYINILMRSGILVLIIFLAGIEICLLLLAMQQDYLSFMILLVLSIYGSIELMIYLPMWNIFLIFLTILSEKSINKRTILGHCINLLQKEK